MKIEKGCIKSDNFKLKVGYYDRARDAFASVLDKIGIKAGDKVLLPAYIGWSAREGSGVFDPVSERNIVPIFYKLDALLAIDLHDVKSKIITSRAKAILLIHYFGFVDKHYKDIVEAAKAEGMTVIEDAAHALLTGFTGNICGRGGDYTIYSLHKMLPMESGGMLAANRQAELPEDAMTYCIYGNPFHYDFRVISKKRVENYKLISQLLARDDYFIKPVCIELPEGVIPQTYPVLLIISNRDEVYRQMNNKGWGVVSLYHTLIDKIEQNEFCITHGVSKSILNLPVHQDVDPELIGLMIGDLKIIARNCI